MIAGVYWKFFAPTPTVFLFAILLKYQVFLVNIHFALLKGGASTYCISPECSFHGWVETVMLIVLQVPSPFQMMSGFMSWGTWIMFMV